MIFFWYDLWPPGSCTNIELQDDLPELEEGDGKSKIQEVS